MLKKFICLLVLLCVATVYVTAETVIPGTLTNDIPLASSYDDNPVEDNIDPFTGLASSGEAYTPIMVVIDNSEAAHPHWGVSKADILFQVPNAGKGATKILALFADQYPENAGGCRSGRGSMVSVAKAFDAAFAYAGYGEYPGANVNVKGLLRKWDMLKTKSFNLLETHYSNRVDFMVAPHNLSCHIAELHTRLQENGAEFSPHPFLFTDTPLNRGVQASNITLKHYGDSREGRYNNASFSSFAYDVEAGCYYRTNASGIYIDRDTNDPVPFANVIVLRTKIDHQDGSVFLAKHLVGHGTAEIFQNGRYIQGAWVHNDLDSRLVFTDENGNELAFQRGKTFIVITNDITDVIYE